jgi:phospholipase C
MSEINNENLAPINNGPIDNGNNNGNGGSQADNPLDEYVNKVITGTDGKWYYVVVKRMGSNKPSVYTKRLVPDANTLQVLGFTTAQVITVLNTIITPITTGDNIAPLAEGMFIKDKLTNYYLIQNYILRLLPDAGVLATKNLNPANAVLLADEDIELIKHGPAFIPSVKQVLLVGNVYGNTFFYNADGYIQQLVGSDTLLYYRTKYKSYTCMQSEIVSIPSQTQIENFLAKSFTIKSLACITRGHANSPIGQTNDYATVNLTYQNVDQPDQPNQPNTTTVSVFNKQEFDNYGITVQAPSIAVYTSYGLAKFDFNLNIDGGTPGLPPGTLTCLDPGPEFFANASVGNYTLTFVGNFNPDDPANNPGCKYELTISIDIDPSLTLVANPPGISRIKHFFVLMMENRSFDHMLSKSGIYHDPDFPNDPTQLKDVTKYMVGPNVNSDIQKNILSISNLDPTKYSNSYNGKAYNPGVSTLGPPVPTPQIPNPALSTNPNAAPTIPDPAFNPNNDFQIFPDPGHEPENVIQHILGASGSFVQTSSNPPKSSYSQDGKTPYPTYIPYGTGENTNTVQPSLNTGFIQAYVSENTNSTTNTLKAPEVSWTHPELFDPSRVMNVFSQEQLPVLQQLANAYTVCDRWFSSLPGPTWPNRFYLHAGTSDGYCNSPTTEDIISSVAINPFQFQHNTIYHNLSNNDISWRIYHDGIPAIWSIKDMSPFTTEMLAGVIAVAAAGAGVGASVGATVGATIGSVLGSLLAGPIGSIIGGILGGLLGGIIGGLFGGAVAGGIDLVLQYRSALDNYQNLFLDFNNYFVSQPGQPNHLNDYPVSYTFIEPRQDIMDLGPALDAVLDVGNDGNSQHASEDVTKGEKLIQTVYETIRQSNIWTESALIITYDEHGGFYDHIVPPINNAKYGITDDVLNQGRNNPSQNTEQDTALANQSVFDFTTLGVRVPAIVISPYTRKGGIDSTIYDHSSVYKTMQKRFNLTGSVPNRVANTNDFCHLFDDPQRDEADCPMALGVTSTEDPNPPNSFKTPSPSTTTASANASNIGSRPLQGQHNSYGFVGNAAYVKYINSFNNEDLQNQVVSDLKNIQTAQTAIEYLTNLANTQRTKIAAEVQAINTVADAQNYVSSVITDYQATKLRLDNYMTQTLIKKQ